MEKYIMTEQREIDENGVIIGTPYHKFKQLRENTENLAIPSDLPREILYELFQHCYQLASYYAHRDFKFHDKAFELANWFLDQKFHEYQGTRSIENPLLSSDS